MFVFVIVGRCRGGSRNNSAAADPHATVGPAVAATPLEAAASEEELPRALKRAAPQLLERRLRDQREQVRERRVVYLTEP